MSPDELARRITETAVLRGTFELRSGRRSSWYIDKYLFLTDPEILRALGEVIAARLPEGAQRLAGAELGGVPLVSAVSMASGLPSVYVRNAKKGYGTAKRIEGRLESGERVVVIEDVVTTGGQSIEAAEAVKAQGAEVLRIIATVDREEGGREAIQGAGYEFEALFTRTDLGIETG